MSTSAHQEPLRGALAAASTPMRLDGSVDHAALIRHARWLLTAG